MTLQWLPLDAGTLADTGMNMFYSCLHVWPAGVLMAVWEFQQLNMTYWWLSARLQCTGVTAVLHNVIDIMKCCWKQTFHDCLNAVPKINNQWYGKRNYICWRHANVCSNPVIIRYIRPLHHGHTSQYHGHEWMTHILFRSMSIGCSIPDIKLFQTLTLKQGQGHGCGQRARSYRWGSIILTHFRFISHQ